MKITLKKSLIIALLAACGAIGWVAASGRFDRSENRRPTVSVAVNDAPLERQTKFTTSFAPVVKKVAPSVVNVFTTKTVRNPMPEITPFFDDPFFRRFFGSPFGDDGGRRQPRTFKERSLGSGVIVTKDGYILTNNHVVDGADEIKVARDKDKKKFTAKVVGRDPRTDIAVLKIEAKDLPFITFADSDKLEVGDVVLALGNPFGIGQSVTMGIVSATGRGDMLIEDYEDFIQTDAAINPGNSGGALVDAEGRLVGINTAILSRSGGNQGVGFAVPANLARSVMDQMIEKGKVTRGYLGVLPQDLTAELGKEFNVPDNASGALIGEVTEKSAAAEAGLKSGDVITELNGTPVKDSRNLRLMVARLAPGDKVAVKVLRDGKEKTFTVTLKEMPEQKLPSANNEPGDNESDALNGVSVGDIDSAARSRFNIPERVKGALITDVDADSASYEAGLRPGDVIQEIDHKRVTNAEEAVEVSKHVQTKQVLVRIWSRGGNRYVVVDEGKSK
ncbi:MAG: peptidase S1 [Verrucomicrobia bacterium]|nr:MAG: peptidase S1 [Verrucomicrobiota bacterium]PYJ95879.1 MAG: peptidase S1 [Verrucomicrobiota bacterium]